MKRILFVINTLGTAGAEKALLELLRRIDSKQYEVDLYVLMNQGELREEIPSYVNFLNGNFDDAPIHGEVGKKHLTSHVAKTLLRRGTFLRSVPYIFQNGMKMVIEHHLRTDKLLWNSMAMGADRFGKEYDLAVSYIEGGSAYYVDRYVKARKKICFLHVDYVEAGYNRRLDKDCYLHFDRIYGVSDEVRDAFLTVYPELSERTGVFHNLINMERVLRLSEEEVEFPDEDEFVGKRILTVGRLNEQKAFDLSIRAMKLLIDQGENLHWYILGEGDLRESLQNLIDELGLQKHFILVGNVKNPYPYIRKADYYVHATKFEGKSIAIQEAQILSKPIIVSDVSGNREQVENHVDGLLVELSPEGIAEGIKGLLSTDEKAKAMGQKANERIRREAGGEVMVQELLGFAE